MSIPSKDGTGADIELAAVSTPAGLAPISTPGDPITGAAFKASSEATLELIRQLLAGTVSVSNVTEGTHFQPGFDVSSGVGNGGPLRTDPDGNLVARAQALTDELGYRANFANTSLAVALGTATFTNGSAAVTGSGFVSVRDLRTGDYVKLDADAESAWIQVESLDGDGALTLVGPYTGTGGTGAASRAIVKPVTGSGATISVANGQCTIAAGTTTNAISEVKRDVDWLPLIKQAGVSVSQRIANQTIYIGFYDESHPTTPYWFAWFALDGTVNTTVKCQSGRNPTSAPSAAETEETVVTIPNGGTTATVRRFRPEVLGDRVNFFIDGVVVATHYRAMPGPGDLLTSTVRVVNGGTSPASNTNVVIDYDTVKNHNKLEVGLLSDAERIVAAQPEAEMRSYSVAGVIAINTDLITVDCSQLRSLSIHCTSMGTTGVVTGQWSNSADFTGAQTATLVSESGATSTTFNAAVLRTASVRARYFRLRLTTATTGGTTTITVAGFQQDLTPAVTTQPVDTELPTAAALADAAANATTPTAGAAGLLFNSATWDRARGMSTNLTTGDTGAKSATGNGATLTNVGNKGVQVLLNLGAFVGGTSPTLALKLQGSVDGGTSWYDIPGATTAALTATGLYGITVYPGVAATAGTTTSGTTAAASHVMPRTWRTVWTITGAPTSITITNVQYNYLNN